jgi:acyl-CoA synthetase (AMP-forming)/AMP-acid ligase II
MLEPSLPELVVHAKTENLGVRFIDRSERATYYSYEDIFDRAVSIAGGLEQSGIRRGDRIAVILPTSIGFFDAFFGATLAGAVPVPLYPPVRLGRLEEYHIRTANMLKQSGAVLLLTDRRVRRLLGRTLKNTSLELGASTLEDLPRGSWNKFVAAPDDLAVIQFSSGTHESPKPVRLTHRQIIANIDAIRGAILEAYPESDALTHVAASWLPLYHDMGLVGSVLTAMAHPSDLVLMPPEVFVSRPSIWLRTISRFKATVTVAPNFAYSLCVEKIKDEELNGVDLSSLRVAFNGAEPVTPSSLVRFVDRFRSYGLREEVLTPVYGLAEATLAVTFSDLSKPFRIGRFERNRLAKDHLAVSATEGVQLASVGKPLPGYGIRIVDANGHPLPHGSVGNVWIRGPSVMESYHEQTERTTAVLDGPWLDTGDTGFIHEGELYLYGRRKDLIVIRGRNYAPDDIEQSLEGISGIRRGCWAAAGAVPDDGYGEALFVFVERDRARSPTGDPELARAVSRRILESSGLKPNEVFITEPGTLPRTSSGKIRRGETMKRFLTGSLEPPKSVNLFLLTKEMVRSKLASFNE